MRTIKRRRGAGRRALCVTALALALAACASAPIIERPTVLSAQLGLQAEPAPPGMGDVAVAFSRDLIVRQGVDREFGVDLARWPDVIEYGRAGCSAEPSCLGLDAGPGPWTVWHVRWQPHGSGPWIALVFEASSGRQLWLGADES